MALVYSRAHHRFDGSAAFTCRKQNVRDFRNAPTGLRDVFPCKYSFFKIQLERPVVEHLFCCRPFARRLYWRCNIKTCDQNATFPSHAPYFKELWNFTTTKHFTGRSFQLGKFIYVATLTDSSRRGISGRVWNPLCRRLYKWPRYLWLIDASMAIACGSCIIFYQWHPDCKFSFTLTFKIK